MSAPSTNTQNSLFFRFLDLPTELRLEVYEHVAKNTQQRRFFANVAVAFPEINFDILAASRLVRKEAYSIIHYSRLEQPPTLT